MEHFQTRWAQLASCMVVAICGGMMMSGCESVYERAARLSCQWNHDINLKGCDRWDFASCIDHCEYCVGAPGSPFEGTSDECNQLKCGAYCAKQESDLKCLSTYKFLCEQGKKAFSDHHGQVCDVDCNAAPRALPTLVLVAPIMMLAASKLSAKAFMTLGILLIALHIQGCSEDKYRQNPGSSASSSSSGGALCQPQTPFFGDWTPDFARLDVKAGCNNAWSWLWGNPCASEVPVVFAKKGINEDTDIEHILEGVEVETYNCTKRKDGYCAEWTNFEKSCKEEDFGVCTCNEPAPDNKYCQAWTCITKEAEQNICWRGCCGKGCQPCVKCGAPGSAPFPMNRQVFNKLMANDGIFSNVSKDEDENARRLAGVYLDSEIGFLLESLRRAHWGFSYFGPTCIASRDIHSPHGFPCQEWREIETEIQTCRCLLPDSTGSFCMEWKCEEKDVGQFSILFTVEQSYENLIVGQEVEKYTCQEQQPTSLGGSKCIGWRGEIESREEVEVVQCKGCFNLTVPHCQSWNCDEYEVPKIEHYENKWGRRIGFAILHLLWMSPIVFVCTLFCAGACFESCKESMLGYSFGAIALACCTAPLIYVIAFARYSDTANYWRIPASPFLGALLTLGVASLVFICCVFTHPQFEPEDATAFLFSSWFCCIILFGFAWVGGLVAAAPFLLVYLLVCLFFVVGGKGRKSAPGMFDDAEAEELDNWDNW